MVATNDYVNRFGLAEFNSRYIESPDKVTDFNLIQEENEE